MNINTALEFMTIPGYHLLSPEMLETLNISKVLERDFGFRLRDRSGSLSCHIRLGCHPLVSFLIYHRICACKLHQCAMHTQSLEY